MGPKQGVCCRRCPFQKGVHIREGLLGKRTKWRKKISETDDGSRNIPLTTNLATLTISKLFGLSIKAGNIKLKKKIICCKYVDRGTCPPNV